MTRGWPWQRRNSKPATLLTCYTRDGCCLCDQARRALDRLAARGLAEVRFVAIDGDENLEKRYGTRIPVVCLGDDVLAEGKVSEIWLARALEARSARHHVSPASV